MALSDAMVQATKVLEKMQVDLCTNGTTDTTTDLISADIDTILSTLSHPLLLKLVRIKASLSALSAEVRQHPSLLPHDFQLDPVTADLLLLHNSASPPQNGLESPSPLPSTPLTPLSDGGDQQQQQLLQLVGDARQLHRIKLHKPPGSSLGVSVVGLRSEVRGELGIYVQCVQQGGIAHRDGRLREADQVLSINGQTLTAGVSHQQAIEALQRATDIVDLVIARTPQQVDLPGAAQQQPALDLEDLAAQHLQLAGPPPSQDQQVLTTAPTDANDLPLKPDSEPPPPPTEPKPEMVLSTGYAQVEAVELHNDGSGLGFGIIGGRSTGVVVKTILPGGVADRDGRLQSGDHILMIGAVSLRGLGSDQVASVLRQSGNHVRLIVARPMEHPNGAALQPGRIAPVVETRVLNDPEELDRKLQLLQEGLDPPQIAILPPDAAPSLNIERELDPPIPTDTVLPIILQHTPDMVTEAMQQEAAATATISSTITPITNTSLSYRAATTEILPPQPPHSRPVEGDEQSTHDAVLLADQDASPEDGEEDEEEEDEEEEEEEAMDLPEMETVELQLAKDRQGLGITIAGYVCEREELSGIFVKSINAGSAADRSGKVRVNDQIVQVDGTNLAGLSNHHAVDVLRATGAVVTLRLARYLRGPKYEQLQQAIANSEMKTTPGTPNPPYRLIQDGEEVPTSEALRSALGQISPTAAQIPYSSSPPMEVQQLQGATVDESTTEEADLPSADVLRRNRLNSAQHSEDLELLIDRDYTGSLRSSTEAAIRKKWARIMGPEMDIVVCQLSKFEWGGGLGVSLEGTVDVEGGREVRPHHYIRSILPQGPVGKNGVLCSGDELLEVNGRKLLGLNHVEVVVILKELPRDVRIVCARRKVEAEEASPLAETTTHAKGLGGSLQSLVTSSERLVKAKSDGSLASSAGTPSHSFSRAKSRSLEPLTGLAMWSSEPNVILLHKGDRGLGFSILDYQDPLNPQETVIVIRSLVPGGVAEKDGRLIPGDRLVAVNGTVLEGATLDEAVAALKGAPKGPVEIAVAKPISVLESPGRLDAILRDLPSSDSDATLFHTEDEADEGDAPPHRTNSFPVHGSERLLDSGKATPTTSDAPIGQPTNGATNSPAIGSSRASPAVVPEGSPVTGAAEVVETGSIVTTSSLANVKFAPLPAELHRTLRFKKTALPLGLDLDISGGWAIVTGVVPGGAVDHLNKEAPASEGPRGVEGLDGLTSAVLGPEKPNVVMTSTGSRIEDNQLKAGDVLVSINGTPVTGADELTVRGTVTRAGAVVGEITMVVVPREDAEVFHQTQQLMAEHQKQMKARKLDTQQVPKDGEPSTKIIPISEYGPTLTSTILHTPTPAFVLPDVTSYCNPPDIPPTDGPTVISIQPPQAGGQDPPQGASSDVTATTTPGGTSRPQEEPFTITFRNVAEAPLSRPSSALTRQEEVGSSSTPGSAHSTPDPRSGESGGAASPTEGEGQAGPVPQAAAKHWGPERVVQVYRDNNNSLGISIVGGQVELNWTGSFVNGIFIKNVLPSSPAGKSGLLKTGDRILEVEASDLRNATHERAVEVIKNTGNPVTFVLQSLVRWTPADTGPSSRDSSRLGVRPPTTVPPVPRTPTPELIQPGLTDREKQELQALRQAALGRTTSRDSSPSEEEEERGEDSEGDEEAEPSEGEESSDDDREDQGRVETASGQEIDRASAGALKKLPSDPQPEDQFGYTLKKIAAKYKQLPGTVHLITLQKGSEGLGISLSGHKDRSRMSVFVCGLNPRGNAFKDGGIQVGDEVLEVNGNVVSGRCHLNASSVFKSLPGPEVRVLLLRRTEGVADMAVKPLTHFPVTLEDEGPEEKYTRFKGLTNVVVKKGSSGLGIMIIEGKHAEYGEGIFISDLQEGSAAALAGLLVGDMILSVNKEEMVGADYDTATSVLRKTEGLIDMWVANGARVAKETPKGEEPAPGGGSALGVGSAPGQVSAPRTPAKKEPKKPDVPPKPSIGPKPTVTTRPTTLPLSSTPTTTTTATKLPPSPATRKLLPATTASLASPAAADEPPPNPATAPIKPGEETTIEIPKEKMGLGLSIVGGSDTLLKGAILIHEVYPDGAAAQDSRLRPGDQILEVSGQDFRSITHQKALSVLRQTPAKVQMVVYREEGAGGNGGGGAPKEEDLYEIISVQLTKKQGKGLGLSIVGRKNGPGVFISDLVEGGVAQSDGRLMQGDQILEVNKTDVRNATQEQAAAVLKCAPGTVDIRLGRLKPGKRVQRDTTWPVMIDQTPSPPPLDSPPLPPSLPHSSKSRTIIPVSGAPISQQIPMIPPPQHPLSQQFPMTPPQQLPPALPAQQLPLVSPLQPQSPGIREIILERGDDGLGFSIVGGFGSNLGDLPIYVKSVFERGSAAREGTLRRGDQIISVNGTSLRGLTHAGAVTVLKEAKGTVKMIILPAK